VLGGGAGNQHQVAIDWDELLVLAEHLAESALGAIPSDGVSDRSSGGDDADPGDVRGRRSGFAGRAPPLPPKSVGATIHATALFADDSDVALAA
jgi:hypothetical protein